MRRAAGEQEDAHDHGAEAGPVARVVVLGALPLGEAVAQEVVVALAAGAAEDVGHDGQAGLAVRGALDGGLDLGLGGLLGDFHAALGLLGLGLGGGGALGGEGLLDLVRVQGAGFLAVGLVDLVLGGGGLDADVVVEGDVGALVGRDLVAKAEDFAVWEGMRLVIVLFRGCRSELLTLFRPCDRQRRQNGQKAEC